MNYPALIFWLLIVWSITASSQTVLVLLMGSIPFASLSLLPPEITGGMTLLPQMMLAVVLIIKEIGSRLLPLSPKLVAVLGLGRVGYLALFLLVGIVATIIMPRLFLGEVIIFPMRLSWIPELLTPGQANFTQSGYVSLSVLTAIAVTLMADHTRFAETLLAGILVGGIVCVVTGLIDIAAAAAGLEPLLEPFRNAAYAYLTDVEIGAGARRVVGFTPEASAYGPICVQFGGVILLLRTLYLAGRQRMLASFVALGAVGMAALSTSSTAYAGLSVLALAYVFNWMRRAVSSSPLGQAGIVGEALTGVGVVVILLFLLTVRASLFEPLINVVNEIVLNKATTSSYIERSHWNAVAWDTIAATWGLGIGFGSTRTSSWPVSVISNTGVLGAAMMAIFLVQTFLRRPVWRTPLSLELLPELKLSLLPALAMAGLESPGPDFGLWIGIIFGAITGLAYLRPSRDHVIHSAAADPVQGRTKRSRLNGAISSASLK